MNANLIQVAVQQLALLGLVLAGAGAVVVGLILLIMRYRASLVVGVVAMCIGITTAIAGLYVSSAVEERGAEGIKLLNDEKPRIKEFYRARTQYGAKIFGFVILGAAALPFLGGLGVSVAASYRRMREDDVPTESTKDWAPKPGGSRRVATTVTAVAGVCAFVGVGWTLNKPIRGEDVTLEVASTRTMIDEILNGDDVGYECLALSDRVKEDPELVPQLSRLDEALDKCFELELAEHTTTANEAGLDELKSKADTPEKKKRWQAAMDKVVPPPPPPLSPAVMEKVRVAKLSMATVQPNAGSRDTAGDIIKPPLLQCVEDAWDAEPSIAEVNVIVLWFIDINGSSRVDLPKEVPVHPKLQRCVTEVLTSMRFQPGLTGVYSVPLKFTRN